MFVLSQSSSFFNVHGMIETRYPTIEREPHFSYLAKLLFFLWLKGIKILGDIQLCHYLALNCRHKNRENKKKEQWNLKNLLRDHSFAFLAALAALNLQNISKGIHDLASFQNEEQWQLYDSNYININIYGKLWIRKIMSNDVKYCNIP